MSPEEVKLMKDIFQSSRKSINESIDELKKLSFEFDQLTAMGKFAEAEVIMGKLSVMSTAMSSARKAWPHLDEFDGPSEAVMAGVVILKGLLEKANSIIKGSALIMVLSFSVHAKTFTVRSSLPWMHDVAKVTECVIQNDAFGFEVGSITKFDYSTRIGVEIIENLRKVEGVTLSTYKTWNPASKTIAYRVKKEIYYNTRKNPRKMTSMVNTGVHEALHVAGEGHGNNSSKGKQRSAPYWIGDISEKYVKDCQ